MRTIDDKNFVILGLLIISVCMIFMPVPEGNVNIINSIISGLLGMAIGKAAA